MLGIFVLSSQSSLPQPPGMLTDKAAHAIAYGLLAAFWFRALAGGRWSGLTARRAGLAVLGATAYGLTDELHQSMVPGRTMELADLWADALGASAAACALWACGIILRHRHGRALPNAVRPR
jgi:VanZ family protein